LALWDGERFGAPFEYELPGTPCQGVIDGESCQYLSGVQQRFPSDTMLAEMGIEAYFGTAFGEVETGTRGLLAALHDAPCAEVPGFESMLSILGLRAGAELARLESEAARRRADARYRTIVETCSEGVWMIDAEGRTTFVNAQMAAMLGYAPDEMLGRSLMEFTDDDGRERSRRNLERRREGVREGHEFTWTHRDGRQVHTWMNTSPVRDAEGGYVGALAMVTDMTEQRALEAKLRESERLESLGLLAGGIAHDFNNLLAAILGRAELARDRVEPTHAARPLVEGIRVAADRASHLTRQLLAYAGRAPIAAQPVDRPYLDVNPADPFYRVSRCMVRVKYNHAYPYNIVMMKHAPYIATEKSVKAHETRPDGRALSENTGYQANLRYGSQQSITRNWHMPMHQTDTLFHKAKVSMNFIFGGEADNHAVNTVPKETLVRITKAEAGGLGGKGIWKPAATGYTPDNESDLMKLYLAGRLTRVRS
jgi:PAS domain S-box-containing protein